MKLTKKLQTEIWKIYDTWMQGYLNADVETYNSYFDEDYHFIGSTNNEEFLNRKDTTEFFRATGDQFAGMTDLRKETKTLEVFGEHVFLTHFFDAWFKNDEDWSYYGRFRFSSVMHQTKEGWRFIYQHFSMPDSKSEEGQTIGFDKVHLENQELREAIQRRTSELEKKNRELEVETALERIRAQAVAMKESTDLLDIVVTMRNEFIKLGHEAHYFWHMMWLPEIYEKAMTSGDGTKIGFVMKLPRHIHGDIPLLAKWEKSKKPTVVYTMNVEEAIDYVDKMVDLGDFQSIDPQAPTHDDIRHIGGLTFIMARTTHGEIGFSLPGIVKHPPKEDLDILVQFAGAFDLAHRRFLDLQKAEAQARETQIELALERIRSRVAEMKTSSDLFDIVVTMRNEFLSLGHEADYFWHMKWTKDNYEMSMTAEDGGRLGMVITVPKFVHEQIESLHNWEKSNSPYFVLALNGKEAWDYIENMNTYGQYKQVDPHAPSEEDILHIGGLTFIIARTTHGEIGFSLAGEVPNPQKASIEIILRFAKVFDLAYKRFEDLQKAEAQARETQIELALEKVRSRTMAMQHSDELNDVVKAMFENLKELQIPNTAVGIAVRIENSKDLNAFVCGENKKGLVITNYRLPYFKNKICKDLNNTLEKQLDYYVGHYSKKEKNTFYTYLIEHTPEFGNLPNDIKHMIFESPTYTISMVASKHSIFNINDFEGKELSKNNADIIKRFAKVFEHTYTRFLDLQKAEAQARETQIELALEKVRSRTMAMQHSDELQEASFLLDQQVRALGIKTWGCAFNIYGEKESTEWFGNEAGVLPTYTVPHKGIFKEYYQKGQKGESFYIKEFSGKTCVEHYEYMSSLPVIGDVLKNLKKTNKGFPTYQIDHVAYFKYGYLLFITKEHVPDAHDVFKRFAKVFEQTYTRFLDLQKAEAQARESQIELGLERVRARAMAMQKSNELSDLVSTVMNELTKLDFALALCIINIINGKDRSNTVWAANPEVSDYPESYYLKFEDHKFHHGMWKAWKERKEKWVYTIKGSEKKIYQEYLFNETEFKRFSKKAQKEFKGLKKWVASFTFSSFGGLQTVGEKPLSEENLAILARFGKVFDLTYTRFNDLQKAEAQAKEAQIEMALEKVRSRTMAMQHSDELPQVANTLFLEVQGLGIPSWSCGFNVLSKDKTTSQSWMSSEGEIQKPFNLVFKKEASFIEMYNFFKSDATFLIQELDGKAIERHYNYLKSLPGLDTIFGELEKNNIPLPTYQINHLSKFNQGYLLFITYEKVPEAHDVFKRFTKVFEQTYTRFLDLQKAEAQAREAQIEAALERVRAASMAMHKSEDLLNIVKTLYGELESLNINTDIVGIRLNKDNSKDLYFWMFTVDGLYDKLLYWPYQDLRIFHEINNSQVSGEVMEMIFSKAETKEFFREYFKLDSVPQERRAAVQKMEVMSWLGSFLPHTGLFIMKYLNETYSSEERDIVKRFAKVFEQTYTRFLDLQKAEAQTRQAQINLAVERVRAKALAMHKSEEIIEVVAKLKDEVMGLDIPNVVAATIFLKEGKDKVRMWDLSSLERSDQGYLAITDITFKLKKIDPHLYVKRVWENPKDYFVDIQNSKDLKRIIEFMYENNQLEIAKEVEDYTRATNLKQLFHASKRLDKGKLCIDLLQPPPEEMEAILTKMGAAFDLAYKRFEDLQKAEAQAREAQIETALERVRSRSMAMHNSEELKEVIQVVYDQFVQLNINIEHAGFILDYKDNDDMHIWLADHNAVFPKIVLPYFDCAHWNSFIEAKKKRNDFFTNQLGFEEKNKFYKDLFQFIPDLPEETKTTYFKFDGLAISTVLLDNVGLYIENYSGTPFSDEENEILMRFGKVFQQTYTRFLDLKKAEAQTREAQIETALEKVRSRTMAMQHSNELPEAANNLFLQVQALGIPAWSAGYCIWEDKQKTAWCNMSSEGEIQKGFSLPTIGESYNFYKPFKNNEAFHVAELGGEKLGKHYDFMKKLPIVGEILEGFDEKGIALPTFQIFHIVYFTHGYLMFITYEAVPNEWDIFKRFGNVFEQTYTRFLDLRLKEEQAVKLEKEKQRLEKTLKDLQATQNQLIQSEKMASLGELTAGIAHEIQNPLNFVNNFSEVSKELLDEMLEELENGDMEEVKAIMDDVIQNLEKINHHGKRADGIVKGMLQHSRASGDKKEPTNINALADEYMRLAYHGLRAKDKSFNATLEANFDEKIETIHVIPQDIGRVILNLFTNAFYAVDEKKKQEGNSNFSPKVSVSTKLKNNHVEISVKDNGNGIPKKVLDKIFQPFFTTKPTGQGTGLGLSMSYDIITKGHGGELKVETKKGEGTTFTIQLPI